MKLVRIASPLDATLHGCGTLSLSSTSRSHVGHVRKLNEDRTLDRPDRGLWAVADGMGGHRGGDIAAEITIGALRVLADDPAQIGSDTILAALARANAEIFERGLAAGGVIGSTIVALHIANGRAELFWAGDSRAYHAAAGCWTQRTSDHSLVQGLLDAGAIDEAQAARHPQGHVITRAVGVDEDVLIETASFAVAAGDMLLLCSDGLSRTMDLGNLTDIAAINERGADRLLAEALRRDGSDNISFVLVSVGTQPA